MTAATLDPARPLWPGLARLAGRIRALTGWRRLLVAFVAGLLSAGAFPPVSAVVLLVPAFVTLMWQFAATTNGRSVFLLGWTFGAGHFIAGLYWVGIAMTVDLERFWWFLPISILGLSLGLALFIGAALWATWRTRARGPAQLLLFVAFWLAAEWLRSWLLSGFPWNLIGNVWSEVPAMLQLASLTGVWGLSVVTLLAAVSLSLLGTAQRQPGGLALIALAWALLAATYLFGALRLPPPGEPGEGPRVRIAQPSVPQSLKWDAGLSARHVERLMALTRGPGFDRLDLVVWPETAVPFNLWHDSQLLAVLSTAVPPGGLLVTGAPRYLPSGEVFNALHVIDGKGSILATYDKVHLVPFGEYVPLSDFLGALDIAVARRGGISSGPGAVTLDLPGLPSASPLICYEVIFPGAVTAADRPRPGFLLNLTNDAWFGRSSGPYQHFGMAKLRAAEEGLPLVRAANNGISAFVDPYGRVLAQLGQDEIGVLDATLPSALPPTLFSRIGNWSVAGLFLILILLTYSFGQVFRPKRQA